MKASIGQRVLYCNNFFPCPQEGCIQEYSPSEVFVKIGLDWYNIDDVEILEVLPDQTSSSPLPPPPPPARTIIEGVKIAY